MENSRNQLRQMVPPPTPPSAPMEDSRNRHMAPPPPLPPPPPSAPSQVKKYGRLTCFLFDPAHPSVTSINHVSSYSLSFYLSPKQMPHSRMQQHVSLPVAPLPAPSQTAPSTLPTHSAAAIVQQTPRPAHSAAFPVQAPLPGPRSSAPPPAHSQVLYLSLISAFT